uniref:Uncharacterized protein n=1 Tax=Leersia perrieri TaxID=77586 RepID=A0A0D9XSW7_9ORYZ
MPCCFAPPNAAVPLSLWPGAAAVDPPPLIGAWTEPPPSPRDSSPPPVNPLATDPVQTSPTSDPLPK